MALMEATDDYFCEVFDLMSDSKRYYSNYLSELSSLYSTFVPGFNKTNVDTRLSDTVFELLKSIPVDIADVSKFINTNSDDIKVHLNNSKSYITSQPVILLVLYYIIRTPNQLKNLWHLSTSVLKNLFNSIGHSFDDY